MKLLTPSRLNTRSGKWKTDPRTAYIPGAAMTVLVLLLCVLAAPAWSAERPAHLIYNAVLTAQPSSPAVTDSCLPLLKSIHSPLTNAVTDRNQRSAGMAANTAQCRKKQALHSLNDFRWHR